MIDGHFGKLIARVLEFFYHFNADCPVATFQLDAFKEFAPDQAKVAVDIPELEPKSHPADMVVDAPDNFPVQRIIPGDFVPVDNIDAWPQRIDKESHLQRVILGIAIRVENPLFARQAKAVPQRRPIALVAFMMNDCQFGDVLGQLVQHIGGVVAAAIVDNDDFVISAIAAQADPGCQHHAGNGSAIVVSREDGANAGQFFFRDAGCHQFFVPAPGRLNRTAVHSGLSGVLRWTEYRQRLGRAGGRESPGLIFHDLAGTICQPTF